MLSKRISRYIKSLQLKKYRKQENSFIVEGAKGVIELLKSDYHIQIIVFTKDFDNELFTPFSLEGVELIETNQKALEQIGTFKSNDAVLAVATCKPNAPFDLGDELILALDDVRDPGNLGTIIRIADWYGINKILCSSETADFYNPKVINATMGSFTRVEAYYTDLYEFLNKTSLPVYGALLEGENIYNQNLSPEGILVMGNESHGVGKEMKSLVTHPLNIPRRGGAESLNVSIATAVILDNFFR
jgi:RNA methyltransferase, TrmH family